MAAPRPRAKRRPVPPAHPPAPTMVTVPNVDLLPRAYDRAMLLFLALEGLAYQAEHNAFTWQDMEARMTPILELAGDVEIDLRDVVRPDHGGKGGA